MHREMYTPGKADMIWFIAGEDLSKGDRVTFDAVMGKLRRCRQLEGTQYVSEPYLTLLPRDYKAGEAVDVPWRGGW